MLRWRRSASAIELASRFIPAKNRSLLTDVQIRKSRPKEKAYRLADGKGLHVHVTPQGSKLWRMRYEFDGREKLLSFGPYPEVSLADARDAREAARATLRAGADPGEVKRIAKINRIADREETFVALATEWFEQQKPIWSETHACDIWRSLERDVFASLGKRPIREITPREVLATLRAIEKRPAVETARRVRQRISAVFVFAIASGRADADPAAIVQGALAPLHTKRQPAVLDLDEARAVLKAADATPAHVVTRIALRLLALTALRPGTLAQTPWSEFDAIDPDKPVWRVPAARMKLRKKLKDDATRDHLVPLSRQAVEAIAALRTFTGHGRLAFPNTRHGHRPMSENAMGYLLNRAGYHHRHVPHGWRATFSTVMNERFPQDRAVIDAMLSHVGRDKVESTYNRAAHLERRRELAQLWADLLMEGQAPVDTIHTLPRHA